MSELEEYKEEKPDHENEVEPIVEPKKKKGMSWTTKIIIGLLVLSVIVLIFKYSYKPKVKNVPLPLTTMPNMEISSTYDLKAEVSKFLQKQVEYIM